MSEDTYISVMERKFGGGFKSSDQRPYVLPDMTTWMSPSTDENAFPNGMSFKVANTWNCSVSNRQKKHSRDGCAPFVHQM